MSRRFTVLSTAVIALVCIAVFNQTVHAESGTRDGSSDRFSGYTRASDSTTTQSEESDARTSGDGRTRDSGGDTRSTREDGSTSASSFIRKVFEAAASGPDATSTIVVPNAAVQRVLRGGEDGSTADSRGTQSDPRGDTRVGTLVQEITQHTSSSSQAVVPPIRTSGESGTSSEVRSQDSKVGESRPAPETPVRVSTDTVVPSIQLQSLNAIGQAIHNISAEKQGAADRVNEIVTQVIRRSESESGDKAKPEKAPYVPSPVRGTSPTTTSPLVQPSVPAVLPTREHREEIAKSVERSLPPVPPAQGEITPPLPLTLDASIEDIQRTIEAQTGQRVDVSPGSRQIAKEITTATQNIGEQQQKLAARDGLELYRDSDHDGVSDYDEKNIYRTNPESAYTAGSPLTDGERILLGLDPLATSTVQVPVESPKVAGEESKSIFEVRSIIRVAPAATTTRALATASTTPETPEKIQISGRGLPNSFVTLYVFSTPVIVTIKTDENGLWTYTLDTPLEDGQHELYVASVNDSGKIIAKSPPVLFTKTAEALDYQPLVIQDISEPTPLDTLRQNFLVTGGVIALIFIGIAVVASGIWRQRPPPALA